MTTNPAIVRGLKNIVPVMEGTQFQLGDMTFLYGQGRTTDNAKWVQTKSTDFTSFVCTYPSILL